MRMAADVVCEREGLRRVCKRGTDVEYQRGLMEQREGMRWDFSVSREVI
jgi:hypothetical protein